jgi:hypothetical protein
MAIRALSAKWGEIFPNNVTMVSHTESRAIDLFDAYCEHWLPLDSDWKPIDSELGFIVKIAPRPNAPPFDPFNFLGRVDGLFERVSRGDCYVKELKTTSSGVQRRLKSLKLNRQPIGYVSCLRSRPDGRKIVGHISDVILTATQKMEFDRDVVQVSMARAESWRQQTIQIVMEWRQRLSLLRDGGNPDDVFWQNTEECFKYGQCPYYDLCDYGVSRLSLPIPRG